MDFTRKDVLNYFGITKGRSKCIALRRGNLGYFKMVTSTAYNDRIGKHTRLESLLHFTPDECIKFFTKKIEDKKKDAFSIPNPMYIKSWEEIIEMAKYFKGKENDIN